MESVSDVRSEFLLAENESITNMHRRLRNVCGDMAVDKSTVSRWAKRLASSEQGQDNVFYLPRSGLPSTAVTPATMQRADSHIRNDRRVTTREFAAVLGIGKGSVEKIIHQLGNSKVCARWVPRSLTEEHNEQRKIICSELLARYEAGGDDFCPSLSRVMGHGFITSSPRRNGNPWSGITRPLSLSQQDHGDSLLGL
jgi:histone-lysine N-methyltransferase SETMAR